MGKGLAVASNNFVPPKLATDFSGVYEWNKCNKSNIRQLYLRVDRIRSLESKDGTGFIEHLFIWQTSVFGRIESKDVKVQDLLSKNLTREN